MPVFGALQLQPKHRCVSDTPRSHRRTSPYTNDDHLFSDRRTRKKIAGSSSMLCVDCRTIFRRRLPQPKSSFSCTVFFFSLISLSLLQKHWRVERVHYSILRSFVQQYINYCKAIPLTYELYDENERKKKEENSSKNATLHGHHRRQQQARIVRAHKGRAQRAQRTHAHRLALMEERRPRSQKIYTHIQEHRYGRIRKIVFQFARVYVHSYTVHIRRWQYPNK